MTSEKKSWTVTKCDTCGIPVLNRQRCGSCVVAIEQLTRINPRGFSHLAKILEPSE